MLIPIGFLGLGSLGWISRFTGPGFTTTGKGIAVDSSANVYSTGDSTAGGGNTGYVVKTNSEGVIQWQREFSFATGVVTLNSIALDSSDNVYVVGNVDNESQINKYNTSGALQWQRRLDAGAGATSRPEAVAVSSGGNVYIAGSSSQGGVSGLQVAKYNTSGTLQWQKKLSVADQTQANGIALDSSENVYVVGTTKASGTPFAGIVAKYNSSGTIQWQRKITDSSDVDYLGVVVDSSGNAYVVGYYTASGQNLQILKYNTSGTLQWQKSLLNAEFGQSITLSGGFLYVVTLTSSNISVIAKYDTSGNLQWQRSLTASQGQGIASDSTGNIYFVGRDTASTYFIAKLTDDGTVFGPVSVGGTNFTYQATTYTDATSSSTSSTSTLTDATSTLTSQTTTFTDSAMTFTGVT
jgi:hypothetical protein